MLGFWWHISPHITYKKQMLQGYFLARDHFYICDCKFAHGPTEMDAWSYGKGWSVCMTTFPDVCDEMDGGFFGTCVPKKQVHC